ncbi:MAG: 3-phosphoshikimate 1-carboxyvinyltransferase [candidate division KSB1 bacterium]|nr:3-phosphoshikimate 1-carboxyvinyltransferase [candidate division KSB1 bacterium]MDZ7275677.1 3-phosphoshikimate 1-carboxyvinyltransferase [candidate division KSB1 bacterium]MDZ7284632.1 3-phosphoshikimate 1-carboxyvinyltransferase [candidate division KSB1 bacterium]MDZ7297949.1 3-phosphoshikimate 1-carboxyvinyltransferase [candidate division KSB1 bacterium]MDZ7308322.1 3-phosphoshikimate 1-carboxyvinyltransferase [candidate division KSB1 bacterium]
MNLTLNPVQSLTGRLSVPGDKSISHRALMLAAVAQGESRIAGLSPGADVNSTRQCLQQLAVAMQTEGDTVRIRGRGFSGLQPAMQALDAGNSGTTMRLLSGLLAGRPFTTRIYGDASLNRRPMQRIIEPLQRMGARLAASPAGTAPLTIHGGSLTGIRYEMPVASAQVKSCILFAGLQAAGETTVLEPLPTRDHSERLLAAMGAAVQVTDHAVTIRRSSLQPASITVPGDFSSAAFLLAAATLLPNGDLILDNINVNPTRIGMLHVLRQMGAAIDLEDQTDRGGEPVANMRARHSLLQAVTITPQQIPQLIDEIPTLAVLATQAEGQTVITGAQELRVKESDRLAVLTGNLRAMGAKVEELPDGLIITGPVRLQGAMIDPHGDHRMAMAFAIAGLIATAPVTIQHAECVDISFPGFFELLRRHCR